MSSDSSIQGKSNRLTSPELILDQQGLARSALYDDIFHSRAGGLAQARHVFLHGNGLPQAWRGKKQFTILETGFGLGINFLAVWQAWRDDPQRCECLNFISIEKHPLRLDELRAFLSKLLPNDPYANNLSEQWPVLTPGIHRLNFEQGKISLLLGFGDVQTLLPQLVIAVDAFFLDGFAPRKNPAMWSLPVCKALARLAQTRATLATWCVATEVRRSLTTAGFTVSKAPGFGSKREMTVAVYQPSFSPRLPKHWYTSSQLGFIPGVPVAGAERRHAVIVGAGIAGLTLCEVLTARGWQVDLIDTCLRDSPYADSRLTSKLSDELTSKLSDELTSKFTDVPCSGARIDYGLFPARSAALTPLFAIDDNHRVRLSRNGVLSARRHWAGLNLDAGWLNPCGSLRLAQDERQARAMQRAVETLNFPDSYVRWCSEAQARELAGARVRGAGYFFPIGASVCVAGLRQALLDKSLQNGGLRLHTMQVSTVDMFNSSAPTEHYPDWQVSGSGSDSKVLQAPILVLANGAHLPQLSNQLCNQFVGLQPLPLRAIRGQLTGLASGLYPSYPKIPACERSCGRIAALQSLDGVNDPSTFCALHCIPQSSIANPVPSGTKGIDTQTEARSEINNRHPMAIPKVQCVVSGHGYILPPTQGITTLGSTYEFEDALGTLPTNSAHIQNLKQVSSLFESINSFNENDFIDSKHLHDLLGWVGARAELPDRFPLIGYAGLPGLFLFGGFASRGLSWASLGAEVLASIFEGQVCPLERDLLQRISPSRFSVRASDVDQKRGINADN